MAHTLAQAARYVLCDGFRPLLRRRIRMVCGERVCMCPPSAVRRATQYYFGCCHSGIYQHNEAMSCTRNPFTQLAALNAACNNNTRRSPAAATAEFMQNTFFFLLLFICRFWFFFMVLFVYVSLS